MCLASAKIYSDCWITRDGEGTIKALQQRRQAHKKQRDHVTHHSKGTEATYSSFPLGVGLSLEEPYYMAFKCLQKGREEKPSSSWMIRICLLPADDCSHLWQKYQRPVAPNTLRGLQLAVCRQEWWCWGKQSPRDHPEMPQDCQQMDS